MKKEDLDQLLADYKPRVETIYPGKYVNEAKYCAEMAHSSIDQKRKYSGEPYIVHPRNVAYLVEIVGGTQHMICAAWLHDVLEDVTPSKPEFGAAWILDKFGTRVLGMVIGLTDVTSKEDGNREKRKEIERYRLSQCMPEVHTIKLADLIDNSVDIIKHDSNFAKVYLREKRLLLEVLKKGDKLLWEIANGILVRHGY